MDGITQGHDRQANIGHDPWRRVEQGRRQNGADIDHGQFRRVNAHGIEYAELIARVVKPVHGPEKV
jgi:hypothetical protein